MVAKGLSKFDGSDETETLGLDTLPDRCKAYVEQGAVFAKWRSALKVDSVFLPIFLDVIA